MAEAGGEAKKKRRRLDKASRKLVQILRHGAPAAGVDLDAEGYARWEQLCAKVPSLERLSEGDLEIILASDAKQRLGMKRGRAGDLFLRANQGHSIAAVRAESALRRVASPAEVPVAVHGTTRAAWELIRESGCLKRMARNHVHFAGGEPGDDAVLSGMRRSATVLCYLDVERAMAAGLPLYLSDNGVVLSPGMPLDGDQGAEAAHSGEVPIDLLRVVVDRHSRAVLFDPSDAAAAQDGS